jgi:hypothetical protein
MGFMGSLGPGKVLSRGGRRGLSYALMAMSTSKFGDGDRSAEI